MRPVLASICAALLSGQAAAQDAREVALARETLRDLQPLSFAKNREYCGYLGFNDAGQLVASRAVPGTIAGCSADFPDDIAVVASFHTHGAFDRGYFNEVPSLIDVDSDSSFLLNGYVSTPGGRLWFIDGREKSVLQICGPGCLPVAPGFFKGMNGLIAPTYSYDELRDKLSSD